MSDGNFEEDLNKWNQVRDGRRAKRVLHQSRLEDERRVSSGTLTIMPRPTVILSKPKGSGVIEGSGKNTEDLKDVNERKSSISPTLPRIASRPVVSSQTISKPLSILSANVADKQQPTRLLTATPPAPDTPSQMKAAIRLVGDNLEFTDYVQEYLSDSNTNFCVIAAIGAQGTGKSTLLSMLAGNDHQDMYRQYAFRPASREAVESCRFQTSKISIFVAKNRCIFLDCQAIFSASILDEFLQSGRRGLSSKLADICDGSVESQIEIESIQLLSFLMQVCHTILLCVDWFIDIDVIRHVRTSEMLRSTPLPFAGVADGARFKPNRLVNFVVVQQKAKSEDFYPFALNRRSELLKEMFADSKLKIDSSVSLGGIRRFGFVYPESGINYIPLAEIKPRSKSETQTNLGKDALELHDPIVDFETVVRELRVKLSSLYRDSFVVGEQLLSEKQWYGNAMRVLRSTFGNDDISKYATLLGTSDR